MNHVVPIAGPSKGGRQTGFTLIELLIAVVIIGILGAIAYPSYVDHIRKTRRSEAKMALTEIANRLEKFYSMCSTYPPAYPAGLTAAWPTGECVPAGKGVAHTATTEGGNYALTVTDLADGTTNLASEYKITATAQAAQANDTKCATLILDSTGTKSATGGGTDCW
jgi:type IV pilus assembly protein PilE